MAESDAEAESITNPFDDDTDEDATYSPVADELDASSSIDSDKSEQESAAENGEPPPKIAKHPGRKKTRRPHSWKQNIRAKARNEGKTYTDRKGKLHDAKKLIAYDHNCRFKCNEKLSEEARQKIFDEYWQLGDWELQSFFLNSSVVLIVPERKNANANRSKSVSCQFFLGENRVCKEFFLKTLDVSNKRMTNVIDKKKGSNTTISPRDKRGRKPPANKTPSMVNELVVEHISKFPRYSSHYSRLQAPNKKYLNPHLNIKKLYKLYQEYLQEKGLGLQSVTESYYRHVFNTKFNLSFKKPQTDTCNTCDRLQNIINHGAPNEKNTANIQKELHLRKADSAKSAMKKAKEESEKDSSHIAICFDLQKMLPTPVLTCSRVYYSRQLWTYNLCVHNTANSTACMFLWHEGQASRGCEEIISCLLKYIKALPPTVTHLTAFSDNCGGQNKSQFIVKFWLYVINQTNVQTIDHKFLQSGHSYNDCDRDFGTVEREKKKHDKGIYIPDDWIDIIARSSKRFFVIKMNDEDFVSLEQVQRFFVKSVSGIRQMQWLQYRKAEPWTLFYKDTFNEDIPFSSYEMQAKKVGRIPETLPMLTSKEDRKKIKMAKYKDLLNLLQFIPPIHHEFYQNLPTEKTASKLTRSKTKKNVEDATPVAGTLEEQEDEEVLFDNVYDSDGSE